MGQPQPLLIYFRSLSSRIRTWIVGEEGEQADHLTNTTAIWLRPVESQTQKAVTTLRPS